MHGLSMPAVRRIQLTDGKIKLITMITAISAEHKRRIIEIKNELSQLGSKEAAFIRVELFFYEALTLAREYGDTTDQNGLLAALKQLQVEEYAATSAKFAKAAQREKTIRRFINSFRNILTKASKNLYIKPYSLSL